MTNRLTDTSSFDSTAQAAASDPFTAAPGKKTSEYAATVFSQFLASVVALVAVFSPGFEIDSTTQAIIVSFATATLGFSQMVYAWTRSKVKQASAEATSATKAQPGTVVEKAETIISTPSLNTGGMGNQATS